MSGCGGFDPTTSLLAGMDTTALQAALASAQSALITLKNGARVASVEVTGGGQHRAVEYTRENEASLVDLIRLLQAQLGIIASPRSRARIRFH